MADSETKARKLQVNKQMAALFLNSVLTARSTLANSLGESFGGTRKLYDACGYPTEVTFEMCKNRYDRHDISARVVNAYPDATWRISPKVVERDDENITEFEKQWNSLVENTRLFNYILRTDRLAGIGEYGVLFVGYDDGKDPSEEVTEAKSILYLQPFSQENALITAFETDTKSPRFGLPLTYQLKFSQTSSIIPIGAASRPTANLENRVVHWSRIVHIADQCTESDVYGTPRLKNVYNRLQDIETIVAGSAEMFWKGAFPGYSFEADPDRDFDMDMDTLQDEIEDYFHGLQRYLRLQGVKINALAVQVVSPKDHVETQLMMVSAATGIPVRILTGSEMGTLASTQDRDNWADRVDERQQNFSGSVVLYPFVQHLIKIGVLPKPEQFHIEWPKSKALNQQEEASVARTRTEAISLYARTPGADLVVPVENFLLDILGIPPERVKEYSMKIAEQIQEDQDLQRQLDALRQQEAPNLPDATRNDGVETM